MSTPIIPTKNDFCQFATDWSEGGNFCLPDDDLSFASAAWDEALLRLSEALISEVTDITPLALAIVQKHISALHTWRSGKPSPAN